jgi:hypothetical protein
MDLLGTGTEGEQEVAISQRPEILIFETENHNAKNNLKR